MQPNKKIYVFVLCAVTLFYSVGTLAQPSHIWSYANGGVNDNYGTSMVIDNAGNVIFAGVFSGTAQFDPVGSALGIKSSNGSLDIYLAKYTSTGVLLWVQTFGSVGYEWCSAVKLDAAQNIYIGGNFSSTIDFDLASAAGQLVSQGSLDLYVAKFLPNGNFIWCKGIGETADDVATFDVNNNCDVVVTGHFANTCDFNPDTTNTINLTSNGMNDDFVLKLDSSGNFIWAFSFGSSLNEGATCIKCDLFGNFYICGILQGCADFDPGTGASLKCSNGVEDIFIAKYDTAKNLSWVFNIGSVNFDYPTQLTLDSTGAIYVTGMFSGAMDFDPGVGISTLNNTMGLADIFVAKYNINGQFKWAFPLHSVGYDLGTSINVSKAGKLYTAGLFASTIDFNPMGSSFSLTASGISDGYIACYDTANGVLHWASSIGFNGVDVVYNIQTDNNENLYATGFINGTVDIDLKSTIKNLTGSTALSNFFYARWQDSLTGPLPISILKFEAVKEAEYIVCNWSTSYETNNYIFEVERSSDALHFIKIGEVPGAINSNTLQHYEFIDWEKTQGHIYYRLKQVDLNGAYTYSHIASIYRTNDNLITITNNLDWVAISFKAKQTKVMATIFDSHGSQLYSSVSNNIYFLDLRTSHLANGIYSLSIATPELNYNCKFFIIR